MNYLKTVLLTLICLTCAKLISAQKFYIGISSGYAIGIANQRGDLANSYIDYYADTYQFKNVPYSFGKGWNIGGTVGYSLNKNIAIETHTSYHQSANVYQEEVTLTNLYGIRDTHTEGKTIMSKFFRVIPSLVLQVKNEKINPYMKIGAVIGFGSIHTEATSSFVSSVQVLELIYTKVVKGGIAFGGKGTLGVDYMISSKWSLYSEFYFMTLSYAPEYGDLEASDGTKMNYNYDDSFSESEKFILLFDLPETLKRSYNFNSCGLDLGVKFSF